MNALHKLRLKGTGQMPSRLWLKVRTGIAVGALLFLAAACSESPTASLGYCQSLMDKGVDETSWTEAITACEALGTAEGDSLAAQAYMGRAGVSLSGLMIELAAGTTDGFALMLNAFSLGVTSTEFADVDASLALLLKIADGTTYVDYVVTNPDYFNMFLASNIALTSVLVGTLNMTLDPTTGLPVIPGITDVLAAVAGLSAANPGMVQTTLNGVYTNSGTGTGSYYTTAPPVWDDSAAPVDLKRISGYVQANYLGAPTVGLYPPSDPNYDAANTMNSMLISYLVDNGTCGFGAGTSVTDPATAAAAFPRRLNTSDATYVEMVEDIYFINAEWAGAFALPSSLMNPDYFTVDCGAGAGTGAFSTCMAGGTKTIANIVTASTLTPGGTGTICGGANCSSWPFLNHNSDGVDNDVAGNGVTAMTELGQVLDSAWPEDETVATMAAIPAGAYPAYACAADDGIIHYREFDYFLRTFGL